MKTLRAAVLGMVASLLAVAAAGAAGKYDGTTPMLCAVMSVSECEAGGQCEKSTGGDTNLPPFLRIDVGQRVLAANDGSGRKTEIKASSLVDGQLVLQGGEAGRGWSIVIATDTGRLGAAIVEPDGAFAIFGACTLP
jgi:hypothetical protein